MPSRWFIIAFLITATLAALHFYALQDFLYWKYRWFDTVTHFLGGMAIGATVIALSRKTFRPYVYVLAIIAAAVAWEVFENVFHIAYIDENYAWDTAHDILNDSLGAILIYVIARFTTWRPTR